MKLNDSFFNTKSKKRNAIGKSPASISKNGNTDKVGALVDNSTVIVEFDILKKSN